MINNGVKMAKKTLIAGLLITVFNTSHAVESTMSFSGTLVKGICLVNSGQPIDVDFGDITGNMSTINGSEFTTRFQKEIIYTISCPGGIQNNALKIKIDGSSAVGTSPVSTKYGNVLATTTSTLGILLTKKPSEYINDNAIKLGEWNNFTYPELMKIYATPVRTNIGANLGGVSGGDFTASATIQLAYQ